MESMIPKPKLMRTSFVWTHSPGKMHLHPQFLVYLSYSPRLLAHEEFTQSRP